MKRNPEIIQALLQYVRDTADGCGILTVPNGDELKTKFKISDAEIHYHVHLCLQANFIEVIPDSETLQGTHIPVHGIIYLTWWGHEFLDNPNPSRRTRTGLRPDQLILQPHLRWLQ